VFVSLDTVPDEEPTATSTPEVATTTDIFDMEPIVPEAKVSTEGWKTCRNEEYGWEIKYPGEWYVYGEGSMSTVTPAYVRTTPCEGASVLMSSRKHKDGASRETTDAVRGSVRVTMYTDETAGVHKASRTTIEELAEMYEQRTLLNVVLLGDNKERALSSVLGDGNLYHELYHDNHWYNVGVDPNLDHSYVDAILSTFRFLDISTNTTATTTQQ